MKYELVPVERGDSTVSAGSDLVVVGEKTVVDEANGRWEFRAYMQADAHSHLA